MELSLEGGRVMSLLLRGAFQYPMESSLDANLRSAPLSPLPPKSLEAVLVTLAVLLDKSMLRRVRQGWRASPKLDRSKAVFDDGILVVQCDTVEIGFMVMLWFQPKILEINMHLRLTCGEPRPVSQTNLRHQFLKLIDLETRRFAACCAEYNQFSSQLI